MQNIRQIATFNYVNSAMLSQFDEFFQIAISLEKSLNCNFRNINITKPSRFDEFLNYVRFCANFDFGILPLNFEHFFTDFRTLGSLELDHCSLLCFWGQFL